MVYNKWKKYNETQLTKNKMDLNIRKMTNHPPLPRKLRPKQGLSHLAKKASTSQYDIIIIIITCPASAALLTAQ